jgi:putative ABC transport system permease protein
MFAALLACLQRLRALFTHRRLDHEFDREVQAHLDLLSEENLRRGMTPEEARYAALRSFGGVTQVKEHNREHRGLHHLEILWQDLRYGIRSLRKNPLFAAVAVLTLALGIGANTAIFSAVYAGLLKPLPFKDPDQLLSIWKKNPPRGWGRNAISAPEFLSWRGQTQAFEDMAAFHQSFCVVTGGGEPEEVPCETIQSNFFPLLGTAPFLGRNFSPGEDKAGSDRVAILSYALWQRRFGGDRSLIGRAIQVKGSSYTVVGIMPPGFSHLYASPYSSVPALWLSGIALNPSNTWNDYLAVGRLKAGATRQKAAAEMDSISQQIEKTYPDITGWRVQLMTLRERLSGDTHTVLMVLMGAVTLVLLIACANVANLLLARGANRANEFAVRKALGASQGRMVRQLLTESLLISLAGGSLGILLAWWGSQGLVALAPPFLARSAPSLGQAAADVRVLVFAVGLALATTFLFGLAPAVENAKALVSEALKENSRTALESRRSRGFRNALAIAEIAIAMVLLVGAGLMIRTLVQYSRVRLGFNPANVLTLRVPLSGERYKEPGARATFWRELVAAVEALPGVESASASRDLPVEGWTGQSFTTAENPNPPAGRVPDANYIVAGPDYFRTLQIPLRRGRAFNERDTQGALKVAIVNEELARLHWPNQDPVGKQLRMGWGTTDAPWLSVVGVAANVLSRGPNSGFNAEVYVPDQQFPWVLPPNSLMVRTGGSVRPESVTQAVVAEIHRLNKDQPASDIKTMNQLVGEQVAEERMVMALLAGFAGLALVLAALGIYSLLSYSVAQRTREIGVRVALGAQRRDVLRLVLTGGTRLALLGIGIGSAGALALTQLMTEMLYEVRATDPVTFVSVAIVLALTALLACYLPARRAAAVDPIVALRH